MGLSPTDVRTLDESVRPLLSVGRAGYHFWLSTSTFFVGFGVLLEALELFKQLSKDICEYLSHRKQKRFSLNAFGLSISRPSKVRLPLEEMISIVGWSMVAAGVAGEFWFDDKVGGFDKTLQKIDEELLVQAKLDASSAIERAARLEVRSAALRKLAEDEAMKRAVIEDRLSYRRIDSQKATELANALRSMPPQSAKMFVYGTQYDTSLVVSGLEVALAGAGWSGVTQVPVAVPGPRVGVFVNALLGTNGPEKQIVSLIVDKLNSWKILSIISPFPTTDINSGVGGVWESREWGQKSSIPATIRIDIEALTRTV